MPTKESPEQLYAILCAQADSALLAMEEGIKALQFKIARQVESGTGWSSLQELDADIIQAENYLSAQTALLKRAEKLYRLEELSLVSKLEAFFNGQGTPWRKRLGLSKKLSLLKWLVCLALHQMGVAPLVWVGFVLCVITVHMLLVGIRETGVPLYIAGLKGVSLERSSVMQAVFKLKTVETMMQLKRVKFAMLTAQDKPSNPN